MSYRYTVRHDLWTSLDEIGLLLGLERLPAESGASYIERLKTRMLWPPGSTTQGLTNALSVEFGLTPYNTEDKTVFFLTHRPENCDLGYLTSARVRVDQLWDRDSYDRQLNTSVSTVGMSKYITIPYTLRVLIDGSTDVDGVTLVQYVEVDPANPPEGWEVPNSATGNKYLTNTSTEKGFIIWRDADGRYTHVLEFKNYVPPSGTEIIVEYMYRNEEGLLAPWSDFSHPENPLDQRFRGKSKDDPDISRQIRILTVDDLPENPE